MKFYITKYALTKGILEVNSEDMREVKLDESRLTLYEKTGRLLFYHAGEWYTEAERHMAVLNAEMRRDKKIASLQKQIAALKAKKFV